MTTTALDVKELPTFEEDIFTLDVKDYIVPESEQEKRENKSLEIGHELMDDIKKNKDSFYKFNKIIKYPESIPFNSNPNWFRRPYGAVGTVNQRASLAFVAKLILDRFGFTHITLDSIFDEIVTKHYRFWKLRYRDKKLCMPEATVEGLKADFPEDEQIQACNSLDEIFTVAGTPVGICESPFFLDNLIFSICSWYNIPIYPYEETRIHEANEILENLKIGCPVPLRVSTEIYLGDPRPHEDYYVTLYGLDGEKAYVVDSRREHLSGVRPIQIDTLLEAMTNDPDSVFAWDMYPLFKPDEFIYSS